MLCGVLSTGENTNLQSLRDSPKYKARDGEPTLGPNAGRPGHPLLTSSSLQPVFPTTEETDLKVR